MITLLNAAPDTGNQGVTALCRSVVAGLASRGAREMTVADHGRGLRQARWDGIGVTLLGLTHSRRVWRSDSLRMTHAQVRLRFGRSAAARAVLGSRAILDISGGDSFTDLYGPRRFRAMVLTKRLALDAGKPLVLLPQTLGPFRSDDVRAEASEILRRADAVWVRDAESFARLQTVLGPDFDPERHRLGVEVAVALPPREPEGLDPDLAGWLSPGRAFPLAGLNVSGLLCNRADAARQSFGLAAPHTDQIEALARALLESDPAVRLLLLPHVHRPAGTPESDLDAAQRLAGRLAARAAGRVRVLDAALPAEELKWVLSRLDWFAGARMHATIGAFSSGVPTLGLGYSDKAAGVFAECGIGEAVADLRRLDARAIAAQGLASFSARARTRAGLAARVDGLRARAAREMDVIARQAGL